jgi:hypothetical protein
MLGNIKVGPNCTLQDVTCLMVTENSRPPACLTSRELYSPIPRQVRTCYKEAHCHRRSPLADPCAGLYCTSPSRRHCRRRITRASSFFSGCLQINTGATPQLHGQTDIQCSYECNTIPKGFLRQNGWRRNRYIEARGCKESLVGGIGAETTDSAQFCDKQGGKMVRCVPPRWR